MDYEFRLAVREDVARQMDRINDKIGDTENSARGLGDRLKQFAPPMRGFTKQVNRAQKQTKGLFREIHSVNRLLRRTTALFGAAFSIGHISSFAGEVIQTEQAISNLFGLTGEELKEATSQAQRISTVFGTDVNQTIETANSLAKQFGVEASQSFDLIGQALEKGVSKDVLGQVEQFAPAFAKAGIEAEQLLGLLAQGQRAGVGDELVGAYAEAIDRIGSMSGEGTIDALSILGLSPDKLKKALEKGEVGVSEVIGMVSGAIQELGPESIKARQALEGIFGSSAQSIQNNLDLLAQTPTAIGAIEDRTTQAAKTQQALLTAWADFKVFISENIVPTLIEVVDWVRENSESLIYWGGLVLKVGAGFGALWASAKLILGVKGMVLTITKAMGGLSGVLKIAKAAQLALNASMLASPIGLIVGGITAAIAALSSFTNIFDGFGDMLSRWFSNITYWFKLAWDFINNNFFKPIANAFTNVFGAADKAVEIARKRAIERGVIPADDQTGQIFNFGKVFAEGGAALLEAAKQSTKREDENKRERKTAMATFRGAPKSKNLGISAGVAGVQAGTDAKNLTINITKLVETLEVNTTNLTQGSAKVKEEIIKVLLSAVNDANTSLG